MESLPLLVADDGSFAAPSELVVASSLRDSFPEFLEEGAGEKQLCKLIERYRRSDATKVTRRAG
jgi:hypothetical protein